MQRVLNLGVILIACGLVGCGGASVEGDPAADGAGDGAGSRGPGGDDGNLSGTNSTAGRPELTEREREAMQDGELPTGTPAGDCSDCSSEAVGAGTGHGFDLINPSDRVQIDPEDGALVLEGIGAGLGEFMWVADTDLPGVVKIDLATMQIVGHYYTGGDSTSRTTVNSLGHAFVASRTSGPYGAHGVTKILPHGKQCPDSNGDGVITTSSGAGDLLEWGEDDCVVWHTELEGDARGMAAQDIPGVRSLACEGFDAATRSWSDGQRFDAPDQHHVWVGGLHGQIYKLDAETGNIEVQVTAPGPVYGGALDGDGRFWISKTLGYLDTHQCTDSAQCEAAATCETDDWAEFDRCLDSKAVKALKSDTSGYGITVDCRQRVWMSDTTQRYDPALPVGRRHAQAEGDAGSGAGGIAVDASGWVWASGGKKTARVDSDTLEGISIDAPDKGVAVASDGRVLTIKDDRMHMIEPGATLAQYELTHDVVQLPGDAYAYSDMTGLQTRLATDEPGFYRQVFEGCSDVATIWRELLYDVEVPDGTHVMFSVRGASTMDGLEDEDFQTVACDASSSNGQASTALDGIEGRYLEVEVRLTGATDAEAGQRGCVAASATSARVRNFGPTKQCPEVPDVTIGAKDEKPQ